MGANLRVAASPSKPERNASYALRAPARLVTPQFRRYRSPGWCHNLVGRTECARAMPLDGHQYPDPTLVQDTLRGRGSRGSIGYSGANRCGPTEYSEEYTCVTCSGTADVGCRLGR